MGNKTEERKKAIEAFEQRDVIGGIFRYINTKNGWKGQLRSVVELRSEYNKLDLCKSTNLCSNFELSPQWEEFGSDAFEIEELEQIKKKPEQSRIEFREDVKLLYEMWLEKESE